MSRGYDYALSGLRGRDYAKTLSESLLYTLYCPGQVIMLICHDH